MKNLTAWDRVQIARSPERKTSLDYIENIFDDFFELHGDRNCKDDKSIVCGLVKIGNQNFTVIAESRKVGIRRKILKEILECQIRKVIEKQFVL